MKYIKYTGLAIFLGAMALFMGLLFMSSYQINEQTLEKVSPQIQEKHQPYIMAEMRALQGQNLGGKLSYLPKVQQAIDQSNQAITEEFGINEETITDYVEKAQVAQNGIFTMTEESRAEANKLLPEYIRQMVIDYNGWLIGKEFSSEEAFQNNVRNAVQGAANGFLNNKQINSEDQKNYLYTILKSTATGHFWDNKFLYFFMIIIMGCIGGLMYIYPAFFDGMPGIKHNHIYHNSATNRGLIGIMIGIFLIGFYILLYFRHYWIAEWIALVDPLALTLRGEPASRWFMYGFLYTLAILVMGVKMFTKYRHSNYHLIRTGSVMFFQLAFAFLIPQLLYQLNLPDDDLKNAWPLNYYLFFDWNIENHIQAGTFGIFMLVWGIVLSLVIIPLFSYLFGKRWYCSWVCGCGGLAETLGDPFRQLSDKTTESWQIERFVIHGVLVFAVVMTAIVLYTYLGDTSFNIGSNRWLLMGLIVAAGAGLVYWHKRKYPSMGRRKIIAWVGVIGGAMILGLIWGFSNTGNSYVNFSSYDIRGVYGIAIGSIFAGVVGTGFYPLMGNRVWCRFGCPLAAILGLQQRFRSRFRITTNGGQCISCGNCSVYCEQGIDVRWYAQRGQNIVRSSCVGCGVCSAVCPRGVLALENGPNTGKSRMEAVKY